MDSTTGYTFAPFVRYFTSERLIIAHGKNGPTALVYPPKDTGKVGVNEIAIFLKRPSIFNSRTQKGICRTGRGQVHFRYMRLTVRLQWDSNPG